MKHNAQVYYCIPIGTNREVHAYNVLFDLGNVFITFLNRYIINTKKRKCNTYLIRYLNVYLLYPIRHLDLGI